MMRKTEERQNHVLRPLQKPWSGGLQTAEPSQQSKRFGGLETAAPEWTMTFAEVPAYKIMILCSTMHDFVTMLLFPHPGAGEVAASLRDAIHCYLRFASRGDAATDKTNPNGDRGQNRETSFFQRKMNISSWRGPGEKTCFYETNPNRELQNTWLQDVVKNPMLRRNKTKPNRPKRNRQDIARQSVTSEARTPKPVNEAVRLSGSIRPDPTRSDQIRPVSTI